jgi:hypothetical protein
LQTELIEKSFILALTGEDYFESDIEAVNAGIELLKNPIQYVRFALAIVDGVLYNLEESQKRIITVALDVIKGKYPTKNLIINCPPALGKTSLVVWGLMSYLYSMDGRVKNLHISRFDELVKDNSNKIRSILTSDAHYRIFGVELSKNTTSKGLWETIDGGAFKASSAGGAITGFRAGRIQNESIKNDITGVMVLDDAQKPTDIYSIPILESINQRWDNTYRSRRASIINTPTILIMQRLGENDLTNHLLNNTDEDWMHLVIPSYVTGDEVYEQSGIYIPHKLEVGSTFKRRWSEEEAKKLLKDVQYSQQVYHTDGEVFQKDWLKIVETLPTIKEWHIKADTATKLNKYNDYTTFSLFGKGTDNKAYHVMLLREKIAVPHLYARFISFVKDSIRMIDNARFNATLQEKEFKVESAKSNTCILKVAIEDRDSGQGLIQTIKDKAYLDNDLRDVLFVGIKRSEGKYSRALRASDKIKDGSYAIWKDLIFKTSSDEQVKLNASNVSYIGVIISEFTRFKADDSHKNDDIIDNVFDMMNYEIPNVKIGGFANSM